MNLNNFPKKETIIYDPLLLSNKQIDDLKETDILNILSQISNELSNSQSHIEATKEEKEILKQMRNDPKYQRYLKELKNITDKFVKEIKSDKVENLGIIKDAKLFIKMTKYFQENTELSDEDIRTKITNAINYFNNKNRRIV